MKEKMGKRDKIIKSAMILLTKHGFHAAPMSQIAEKAGVAAGTIYTYFNSKDDLIEAIFIELRNEMMNLYEKEILKADTTKDKFIIFYKSVLSYMAANPLHFRYLEQYQNSPYGISLRRDTLSGKEADPSPLSGIFREGAAKKEIEIKDLPNQVLMAHVFGPLIALAREHALGFIKLDEKIILKSAEAAWDSLRK
ncbi:MAG TPA: TetR/AcrR family transcriptional regulator [Acidobacteriota bacterium]|nr:TetR/AcrR family transcriptional regulator [Acidobacteriota bacterium]HQO20618.1 TetR/AcrR family transcriptional regulator [Acidobacteriota bacterium]HQQ47901.1 TetR/AcrR family transcriptional regulator [Acidobacteriota bacterium]